jgi:hypothetical protein
MTFLLQIKIKIQERNFLPPFEFLCDQLTLFISTPEISLSRHPSRRLFACTPLGLYAAVNYKSCRYRKEILVSQRGTMSFISMKPELSGRPC